MTLSDSVILEFLDEMDLKLPPKPLFRTLNRHTHGIGYSTVQLRLCKLEDNGFLEKDSDGYYEVSEKRWLAGEIDESELE